MTFVHPLLLGGLLLVGVPVLIHLIMRQKLQHLLFPAMRFLMQRHRTNQRKLQLRHLLLLALRMLLLALVCLALARPKILSEHFQFSGDRPWAAVLVIDTTPSMEYESGKVKRLDEAKRLALELLDELPGGSRVAVLDTADAGDDWSPTVSLARERIAALQTRSANYPVTSVLPQAYDLLARVNQDKNPADAVVPLLFVFSDRMQACWEEKQLDNLLRLRDRVPPPGAHAVFVDVGIDKPSDLAISNLELKRQVIAVNDKLSLKATVRATNSAFDGQIILSIDGDEKDRKPLKLEAGQSKVVPFEQGNQAMGPHQVRVHLIPGDHALTFNDERFAAFEVRGHRGVLTITDEPKQARTWALALESSDFQSHVKSPEQVKDWTPNDFGKYQAVCLMNVRNPTTFDPDLWDKLERYVNGGGGLAIIPGPELDIKAYADKGQALLPAKFVKDVKSETKDGTGTMWNWDRAAYSHPLLAPVREWQMSDTPLWRKGNEPRAYQYWEVATNEGDVLVEYADKEKRAALIERRFDRKRVSGRVLLFTVPLDDRSTVGRKSRWHDYLEASNNYFYLALAKVAVGYLAGEAEDVNFNFECGQAVPIALPQSPRFPSYTIQGPGLVGADAVVSRGENEGIVNITKAVMRGNYTLLGQDNRKVACFSLNDPSEESTLVRVPVAQIERLLGPGAVLELDYKATLSTALKTRFSQPLELFPWLMILLLLLLAVENLLANKFYRRDSQEENASPRVAKSADMASAAKI